MADETVTKQDLERALDALFNRFSREIQGVEDRTAALIGTEVGSLHSDIQRSEARLTLKLEELHGRLDTHAGMLQSGARQITRFFQFSERTSRHWRALAKRVDALEKAIEKK